MLFSPPYSHQDPAVREMRFRTNCEVAARLMLDGHIVFSTIAHGHPISEFGVGTDCQTWNRLNRRQLAWCSELLVLTLGGWQESAGVWSEIRIARGLRKPVRYLELAATTGPLGWTPEMMFC